MLRNFVQMLKPASLDEAIALVRLQEGGINNLLAKELPNTKPSAYSPSFSNVHKTYSNPTSNFSPTYKSNLSPLTSQTANKLDNKAISITAKPNNSNVVLPIKKLTPTEMQARMEKGLCYNCDEPAAEPRISLHALRIVNRKISGYLQQNLEFHYMLYLVMYHFRLQFCKGRARRFLSAYWQIQAVPTIF